MRLILFLFLLLPVIVSSQKCTLGDRYHPDCKAGDWCDCIPGYSEYNDKKSGKQWCICDSLKNAQAYAQSLGLLKGRVAKLEASDKKQNIKIDALQKKDAGQDVEIENIKGRVNNLEGEIKKRPMDLTPKGGPTIVDEPKPAEKPTSYTKKEEPNLGPGRDAPTIDVPIEPWFHFEPETGLFATKTNSPEFNSKWLYAGEVGARFVIEPHNWHGFGIFAHPKYIFGLNKTFIPESDGTAYVQPLQNLSGGLVDACIFYKPIKYTEVFAGYAFSLSKGTEHHSGLLGGIEGGWDFNSGRQSLQLRAQLGLIYKHDLSFFGGLVARLPIKFKPKA